jgi:hypothetical protein
VLGLGFEGLGAGVARHWGLPESLQRCMRRPDLPSPAQAVPHGPERMRWMSVASNELAEAVWQADEGSLGARLDAVVSRHGRALGLGQIDVRRAVEAARQSLAEMAPAMGLLLPEGSRGQRVLDQAVAAPADMADTLTPHQLTATVRTILNDDQATLQLPSGARGAASGGGVVMLDAGLGSANPVGVADALAAGIQDITDTLAGDSFKLNEVLHMVLETMYRALHFQRMVFCLRDPATGRLNGRFGLGDRADLLSPVFQVVLRWPAGEPPDLFGAVCLKGSDTLIADSRAPGIEQRLPSWYRQHVNAPSFLLLPLVMKGAPFGLIYADQAKPGALVLGDRELALLRTLRNQAVMAFRQISLN